MKQDFVEAVDAKDLAMVRIALSNELLLDPRGATFTEMLKYAVDNIPDLFEENLNYSGEYNRTRYKQNLDSLKRIDGSTVLMDTWNLRCLVVLLNQLSLAK